MDPHELRRTFIRSVAAAALFAKTANFSSAQTQSEAPFSKVPLEFERQLATLRSPLLFTDGSLV